ncbi:unnamed protein product [Adineta steineri]|uniref:Uncharacterized protein n=1 Tax=Adineta steineri TaxID=433720 RepID=A0A818SLV6_9BILA|nr:unnamed protein product [Adineta steineri]
MNKIRNVQNGYSNIDSVILSTSGVASCISAVIELENTVFIYHVQASDCSASDTCSTTGGHLFLMKIFDEVCMLDKEAAFKKVYLIGGLNDDQYIKLKNEIDQIREDHHSMTMNENPTVPPDNFHIFIDAIQMNLIGFNLQPKTQHGTNKKPCDNDSPHDYIMDCTIIYDRSSAPHIFAVYQFGGQEYQMNCVRHNSLLLGTYVINTTSYDIQAYIYPSASNSLYNSEFLSQVARNVKNEAHIQQSVGDDILAQKLNELLARVEPTPMFDNSDSDV